MASKTDPLDKVAQWHEGRVRLQMAQVKERLDMLDEERRVLRLLRDGFEGWLEKQEATPEEVASAPDRLADGGITAAEETILAARAALQETD